MTSAFVALSPQGGKPLRLRIDWYELARSVVFPSPTIEVMKYCILITAFLFNPPGRAGVISCGQLTSIEHPLFLDERELTRWVVGFKNKVNSFMLDENSAFGVALRRRGNLTSDQRHRLSYHAEIRPLDKTRNMYAALFYSRSHMTRTLIRASLFQDGGPGVVKGQIPPRNSQFMHESYEACRGLNLSGKALKAFFALAFSSNELLNQEELVFYHTLLKPLLDKHPDGDFFLLGANVVGFALDTFGHEINHGLFSSSEIYRGIVINFWKNVVTAEDRTTIAKILSDIYNPDDETLLIDEFQAYLLQPKVPVPQSDRLATFVAKYYGRLASELSVAGVPPAFPH